jgi:nucleoside-diphosphate-sugar epimerase
MKIIVIGAAGTIGVEVAKALSASKHEVIRASRNGEVKVNLEDTASIRAMFDKIQDIDAAASKRFRAWLIEAGAPSSALQHPARREAASGRSPNAFGGLLSGLTGAL